MNTLLWILAISGWCTLVWFTKNATRHLRSYENYCAQRNGQPPTPLPLNTDIDKPMDAQVRSYSRRGVAPSTYNDETLLTIVLFLVAVLVSLAAFSY